MIKLNDICIQYYRLVPPRHGDQFNTHAMVNETGARPLATHSEKSDETLRIRGIDPRNGGSESRTGGSSSRRGSLVKIKKSVR